MNKLEEQITTASELGKKAFRKGISSTPYRDVELINLIKSRFITETPKDEVCTIALLKAWIRAWHLERLYAVTS